MNNKENKEKINVNEVSNWLNVLNLLVNVIKSIFNKKSKVNKKLK
jgi:hypothetical protein